MAKRIGTNILLCYYDSTSETYKQFAYAKSCEFSIKRDMQEIASPTSGQAKEYIPGRYDWDMSCKCLLSNDNSKVWELFNSQTPIKVCWKDATNDDNLHETYTGDAYIKSLKASAQIHDMASLQVSLQGTGELLRKHDNMKIVFSALQQSDDIFDIDYDASGLEPNRTYTLTYEGESGSNDFTTDANGSHSGSISEYGLFRKANVNTDSDITLDFSNIHEWQSANLKWTPSIRRYIYEKGDIFMPPLFHKDTTANVTFTSDNENICVVDSNGNISLSSEKQTGDVHITATCPSVPYYIAGSATCTIKVGMVIISISDISYNSANNYTSFSVEYGAGSTSLEEGNYRLHNAGAEDYCKIDDDGCYEGRSLVIGGECNDEWYVTDENDNVLDWVTVQVQS